MTHDIIIPDIVAFILFGCILGGFLGIILAFLLRTTAFVYAGLMSGFFSGVLVHWLVKHNVQLQASHPMPDPTPIAAPLPDLQHIVNSFERIFQSWAGHSNFVAACFVGVVVIIAVMIIKVTRIHVEARQPYYDPRYHDHSWPPPLPPGLERYYQPRQLEDLRPQEERRSNLPAVRPNDAHSV